MLRWVPAHQGIEGNEVADCWAKEAARGDGAGTRMEGAEASLAFLQRTTQEKKKRKTKEWLKEKLKGSRVYILKEKEGIRQHLRSERKETAMRYYQLMTGHAAIAPYLKNNVKNGDSEECWWYQSGKKQSREHLFKECPKWKPQIRELWRIVGKDVGWRRAKWKSVAQCDPGHSFCCTEGISIVRFPFVIRR
jgi:hypothetical protein